MNLLDGVNPYNADDIENYYNLRWWWGLTLGDLLDMAADYHPDKEAFVDMQNRLTYGQVREKADRLAIGLFNLGIKPLDRVLVQLPNWNEFVYSYFALQKIGAITVLLIDRYRQHEINHIANVSGATSWIVPLHYKKTNYYPIIEDVRYDNPNIRKVITVRGEVDKPNFFNIEKLISENKVTAENQNLLAELHPDPLQVAHMGPTGGTTGAPKLVPRTHNSLVSGVESCSKSWEQHCQDINLVAGPIGHDLSFSKGFLGTVITQGKLVLLDSSDNKDICETIENEKVTSIIWVPTLAQQLLQYEELNKYDLSSLQKMHSAGGASHPNLVKDVTNILKMKFYNGYGSTEGITTITRTYDDLETICNCVGRQTCPYDTYKVIDINEDELPLNKQGELVIKGPCVFTGYYNNQDENERAFTKDGYFKTGDVARIDDKGYITLTGRIKEMINRGGESISATEIEKLISQHPKVSTVAVVPMSDAKMGEKACAYIQLIDGNQLTFEDIISFLKEKNASVLQLPERIEFIKEMPYTGVGKLNKNKLREDIEKKIKEENSVTA